MKKNKYVWIIGCVILVILFALAVLWITLFFNPALTEEELKTTALTKYPGEIIHTAKSGNDYEIEMDMESGIYTIKMDTKDGSILSLEQVTTEEVSPSVDKLTEEQIKKEISSQGELQLIYLVKDADNFYYEAILHKDDVEVTLKVDPYDATILDATQAPIEAPTSTTSILLTEQEVLLIAASHLNGIADDDAELHHPSGQTPYYLVEVEIENGDDDREAVVQVDAYTGSVKSVKWED